MEGVNWLRYSWSRHTNVILGDEMGLGKTIQVIAFLCSLSDYSQGPFLIVVPLSTVQNWLSEFRTWAPHLNVIAYGGNEEARDLIRSTEFFFTEEQLGVKSKSKVPKFNVIVTSYENVHLSVGAFQRLKWDLLVVDEAHRLKSGKTGRLYQLLVQLDVAHRVLLTGTPLQNSLLELLNLMTFLTGERDVERIASQYDGLSREETVAKLHQSLKMHLLRRVKMDVMKTLPQKHEQVVRVDMTRVQKELYKALLTKNYNVINSMSGGKSSLANVVMQLRKVCNHPYLFPEVEPPEVRSSKDPELVLRLMTAASGKLLLLDRLLVALHATKHRVLIFSQFTQMLDIIEDYLHLRRWDCFRIDGDVRGSERQAMIDTFNSLNSPIFIFLLSTRAGGQGINLATADTVVLYDSDWNPHNDLQVNDILCCSLGLAPAHSLEFFDV